MTLEAIEAIITASAMSKEDTWELVEELTELEREEFEAIWAKRRKVEVLQ